jgi:hypothetical protein
MIALLPIILFVTTDVYEIVITLQAAKVYFYVRGVFK